MPMSSFMLAMVVLSAVAGCTLVVVILGVLIDRTAESHERGKGR